MNESVTNTNSLVMSVGGRKRAQFIVQGAASSFSFTLPAASASAPPAAHHAMRGAPWPKKCAASQRAEAFGARASEPSA